MPGYKEDIEKLLVKPTAIFFLKNIVLQKSRRKMKTVSMDWHRKKK